MDAFEDILQQVSTGYKWPYPEEGPMRSCGSMVVKTVGGGGGGVGGGRRRRHMRIWEKTCKIHT